jgi:hypothetical protein
MGQPQMHPIQPQNHMSVYGTNNMVMNGYGNDMQSSQSLDISGMSGNDYSGMGVSVVHSHFGRLPEQARTELASFENRISYSTPMEPSTDGLSYIVTCSLSNLISMYSFNVLFQFVIKFQISV